MDAITYSLSAVIITGGSFWYWNGNQDEMSDRNTSELYLPLSGSSCRLPDIIPTNEHTQNNLLLCGGGVGLMWSPLTSTWNESITPNPARRSHVSWSPGPDIGTFLIGGVAGMYLTSILVCTNKSKYLREASKNKTQYFKHRWYDSDFNALSAL